MKIIRKLLILILFSFQNVYADNKIEFENWKNQFRSEALSNNISEKTIDMVMANVRFLPKVIEYDRLISNDILRTFNVNSRLNIRTYCNLHALLLHT